MSKHFRTLSYSSEIRQYPFPADNFSKYKMNVIPNKECILIIHKFELNSIFRIKSDSSLAEFARYGVIFTSAINLK